MSALEDRVAKLEELVARDPAQDSFAPVNYTYNSAGQVVQSVGFTPSWGTGQATEAVREGPGHAWAIPSDSEPNLHWWPLDPNAVPPDQSDAGDSGDGWTFDVMDCSPTRGAANVLLPPADAPGAYIAGFRTAAIHPVMVDGSAVPVGDWKVTIALVIVGRSDRGAGGLYWETAAEIDTLWVPKTQAPAGQLISRGITAAPSALAPSVGWQHGAFNNYDEVGFAGAVLLDFYPAGIADVADVRLHIVSGWQGANVWAGKVGDLDPRAT